MKPATTIRYLFAITVSLLYSTKCFTQTSKDSLVNLLYTLPNNASKLDVLEALCEHYEEADADTLLFYSTMEYKLARQLRNTKGEMSALIDMGFAYVNKNKTDTAMNYYFQALQISERVKDDEKGALCYIRMGNLYRIQNNFDKAIECYDKAVAFYRVLKNESGLASALNNSGVVHYDKYDSENAEKYFQEALEIYQRIGDDVGTADALANLGTAYQDLNQLDKALLNYDLAQTIYEKINSKIGMATCLINIGYVYDLLGKHQKALEVQKKGLEISSEIGAHDLIAAVYYGMGEIYKNMRNADSSFRYMSLYAQYQDSIFSEQSNRNIADMQTKYDTEKKERENEILRQEKQIKELQEKADQEEKRRIQEERNRRDNLQYSIILIFILALLVTFILLGGTKLKMQPRMIEGLIFFAFLIFFEFLLVLFDPYVDLITGGAPGWKLLINALVAAAIFPLHAFFEKLLKRKLIKK